jgi:ATP-dependent Lon protease
MSEALEKVKSVKYLPIFSWNEVFMPQAVTVKPVHFHKPADTALIKDVMKDNKIFGVCYSENGEPPEAGALGCAVEVNSKVNFKSGDSNVKFTGIIRFVIERYAQMNTAYPLAEVSFFEDEEETEDEATLQELANEIWLVFHQIKLIIFDRIGATTNSRPLKPHPIPFSFIMLELFQFDIETELKILASRLPSERLRLGGEWMRGFLEQVKNEENTLDMIKSFGKNKNNPFLS